MIDEKQKQNKNTILWARSIFPCKITRLKYFPYTVSAF